MKKIKKQNIKLSEIKVKSFQTTLESIDLRKIKGGTEIGDSDEDFCTRAIKDTVVAAALVSFAE